MKIAGYCAIAVAWAKVFSTYKIDALFRLAAPLIQIFLLLELWSAAYNEIDLNQEMPSEERLNAYLILINLQVSLMRPILQWEIIYKVREGAIVTDILRPLTFPGQMVALQLGFIIAQLPPFIASVLLAFLVGLLSPPTSFTIAGIYGFSLLLAGTISTLLALLMGYVALWTIEIGGAMFAYELVAAFLSGAYIPINMLPDLFKALVEILPFHSSGYTPAAIYTGMLSGGEIFRAVVVQILWCIALYILVTLAWRRATIRLSIQGG